MCYATKDEVTGSVWSLSPCPRPPISVDPPAAASNTSQYSRNAWGSQPPPGGMFLPCCFALLAGCRRVTCKARSTPMPRHSYRERDYTIGQVMLKLRTSIGLTQASLAERLRVSRRAVGEWEGGLNYPKAPICNTFLNCVCSSTSLRPSRRKRRSAPYGKRRINGCSSMKTGSRPC
jgi:DNA-binding XRE family transcriptional regulator